MGDGGPDNEFTNQYKWGATKCFRHKYDMLCIPQSLSAVKIGSL
jgi:hypothetical protein